MKLGPNGAAHWHPDHVMTTNPGEGQFQGWLPHYRTLPPDLEKAGVEVVNCTPGSALDCFPRAKLEEVL
jgi:hypothetical protein